MALPTAPPSGFRDFPPEDCERRRQAIDAISRVYLSYGFSPIATPSVESLEVLMGKGAGENEKLIFKILKRGEKLEAARGNQELADLGLRFDLTVPLARFYSRNQSLLPHPFKAFHIGPVWRAERPQKGRFREFYQCDADILGSESLQCEVDVISAVLSAFLEFGLGDVKVQLNDRTILFALLDHAGVAPEKRGSVCVELDKLDKVPARTILDNIAAVAGKDSAEKIGSSIGAEKKVDRKLLEQICPEPLKRLDDLRTLLGKAGFNGKAEHAPWLVRGFDYYTSTVFEFCHPKFSGSLGGGGRYDRLTEKFGAAQGPACGASIGFERLMLLLAQSPAALAVPGPHACVTVFSEDLRGHAIEAARALRQAWFSADIYPGTGKLKAQFKYADQRRARVAVVIGPEEAQASRVKVKNLKTGEEALETLESLIIKLRA